MKCEIISESKIGNLHKIYFRKPHKHLYGDYENYIISNEGRKKYYQVCYNGLNGLWFEMKATSLDEILEKYGLVQIYKEWKQKTNEK